MDSQSRLNLHLSDGANGSPLSMDMDKESITWLFKTLTKIPGMNP